ncbi:MAG: DUF4179 domain-containing protein [Clostridia bacterium]|nr:DUF4179 domain-containing protein [Clostridia bacterium]
MNTVDSEIKKQVDAFIPPVPESYNRMIDGTISELRARAPQHHSSGRSHFIPFTVIASVIAALFIVTSVIFVARPALAAEVPGVGNIVYSISPKKKANDSDRERIEALLNDAFRSLSFCDYEAAARCFRGDSLSDRGNYLSAAYVDHLLAFSDYFPDGANAAELEIADLQAEQKAFRYTAHVTLDLISRDGTRLSTEDCTVQLWENTKGLYIESIEFDSGGFGSFAAMYEDIFGTVPSHGAGLELIPIDRAYLSYTRVIAEQEGARQRTDRLELMLSELDAVNASDEDKAIRESLITEELKKTEAEITPEVITVEQLASELMYRYWLGRKTGEACDFSDIMERNEQTDLFCWDAVLQAERVSLGALKPLVSVEPGTAEILETIDDTNELIKARFYVYTEITDGISEGVGEEIILTIRKDDTGFTVIGFDRDVGDGLYTYSLKPLAAGYIESGCSWQEAGQMAYEVLHEQIIRDAQWLTDHGY